MDSSDIYTNIRQLSKLSCDLQGRSDNGRYTRGQVIAGILSGGKNTLNCVWRVNGEVQCCPWKEHHDRKPDLKTSELAGSQEEQFRGDGEDLWESLRHVSGISRASVSQTQI